jgi:hypothetical protein
MESPRRPDGKKSVLLSSFPADNIQTVSNIAGINNYLINLQRAELALQLIGIDGQ